MKRSPTRLRGHAAAAALVLVGTVLAVAPASAQGDVRIARDRFGIPHVFASDRLDLAHGAGYAVGQDRLWQAEVFRRAGKGELAEILGPGQIGADRVVRLIGPTEAERQAQFDSMPAQVRAEIEAYAAGLNRAMSEAMADPDKTPVEFLLFGAPRPWTVTDTIAVIWLLAGQFGGEGGSELSNLDIFADLLGRFGEPEARRMLDDLMPLNDPDSPVTVPEGYSPRGRKGIFGGKTSRSHQELITTLTRTSKARAQVHAAARRIEALEATWTRTQKKLGLPKWGSNAMLVSGSRSYNGRPLLYGGPQMGQSIPQIMLEMGLHVGRSEIYGMTIAGAGPAIVIGSTPSHAWTLTSGLDDMTDTYVEELNPANPYQYRFDSAWRDMDCRDEVIQVDGGGPVTQKVCRTVHGPVVAPGTLTPGTPFAFSQRVSYFGDETQTALGLFAMNDARTLRQAAAAAGMFVSSFNVHYADSRGNIAYWHVGRNPIPAPGFDFRLPLPGTGEAEWIGFLPNAQHAQAINPPQGWLANWNNKPATWWPNGDEAVWSAWNRVYRMKDLLAADHDVTPQDLIDIARDVANNELAAGPLRPLLLEAAEAEPPTQQGLDAIELVRSWDGFRSDADGDHHYDAPGYAIFRRWFEMAFPRIFGDDLGAFAGRVSAGNEFATTGLLWRALVGEGAALPMTHDWLGGSSATATVMEVFDDALASLQASFGSSDPSTWLAPVMRWGFDAQGFGSVPTIPWENRGTYQQAVSFVKGSERVFGQNILAPGQSGFYGASSGASPHFDDTLRMYADWEFKPMPITAGQLAPEEWITLTVP